MYDQIYFVIKSYILNDAFHDWNDAPTFRVQSVTRLECLKISHSTSITQGLINNGKTKKNPCFFQVKASF